MCRALKKASLRQTLVIILSVEKGIRSFDYDVKAIIWLCHEYFDTKGFETKLLHEISSQFSLQPSYPMKIKGVTNNWQ